MKKIIAILCVLACAFSAYAQNVDSLRERKTNEVNVYYGFDISVFNPEYMENGQSINELFSFIEKQPADMVSSVVVKAYASPDGNSEHNMNLSQERMESLRDYIVSKYPELASSITYDYEAEDWNSLKEFVMTDEALNESQVAALLTILESNTNTGSKKWRMSKLNTYEYIKEKYYPLLRKASISVEYYDPVSDMQDEPVMESVEQDIEYIRDTVVIVHKELIPILEENSNKNSGYLTGSFESNDHFYVADEGNKFTPDDDRFGSNNYLKLDYYNGNFSAGLQLESYMPAVIGYPDELNKYALSNIYVNWKDEDFQITAGTFYDQFGSGLLFRSWEDRLLGLNNAIMGARFAYNWDDKIAFKALWGTPRLGMEFSDTQVRGADLSVSLANIIALDDIVLSVEGSVLNRYSKISIDAEEAGGKPNSYGWSGRLNFDYDGFFLKGEYVDLGKKLVALTPKRGNAQLVEMGYNGRGLGVTLTGRRLEWMGQKISTNSLSSANLISYVPAMSTQYTYMLTTLHPYNPQVGDESSFSFNSGEIGGQLDAFYNFRRGTSLGGKRGMKVHANFSTYYTLAQEGTAQPGNLLFRDFSFDLEKQWTKEFKMVFLYSMQEYNPTYGNYKTTWLSNIFVADLLYKWTPKFSTRLELQYLTTQEDKKDWMAALLEVNFAPHWSVWASDMYNHGMTKVHYYNAGVSYTKGRTRLAAGYGRYKDGFICSGGVCRQIPQYTGANFSITTSF